MADDNDLSFKLSLDSDDFAKGAQDALSKIQSIGKADNLSELLKGFAEMGLALGAVGVAVYAFKEALDLTVEGEEIQQIQDQFNMLSAQAGISGEALKEGLEQGAGGLITTTDLLKIANKALVTMGSDAAKLPELLEIARKSTLVFGGDAKTTFEELTQAVEMGNQRILRRMGINIDATMAEQKYANQLGLTVSELSQAGKQHAILNAVLADGAKEFQNVNLNQQRTVDIIQEAKTSFQELGEAVSIAFSKTIGPTITAAVGYFRDFSTSVKNFTLVHFGNETQKAAAQSEILKGKIKEISDNITALKGHQGLFSKILPDAVTQVAIQKNEEELKKFQAQLSAIESQQESAHKKDLQRRLASGQASDDLARKEDVNAQEVEKVNTKFTQELLKLRQETAKVEKSTLKSVDAVDQLMEQQKLQRAEQHAQAIRQINQTYGAESSRAKKLAIEETKRYNEVERQQELQTFGARMTLLKQWQLNSENFWSGLSSQARVSSEQARHDLADMGKTGQEVMKTLDDAGTAAFTALGKAAAQGSQSAAKAMGNALLGALGQFAVQKGSTVIAAGVADSIMLNPIGPAEIAAGGTLVALGSAINALAGTSSSTPSVSSGGSPSASAAPAAAASTQTQQSSLQQQQLNQRTVQVNIQGNYLNTPQAQRSLMEMMRNESDATSFQYNQIGVK